MTTFENILEDDVGEFGFFQVRLFILVSWFETPAAWSIFLPVFTLLPATWQCSDDVNATTFTTKDNWNLSESCAADGEYCANVTFTDDRTSINTDLAVCGEEDKLALITPLQMAAIMLGNLCFGWLSDTVGRRFVLFFSFTLLLASVFASAFAPNWEIYLACRICTGMFFAGLFKQYTLLSAKVDLP